MDHEVSKLIGGFLVFVSSLYAVYAIYVKSLNNKKGVKDLSKENEELRREVAVIKDQLGRIEKQNDKQDAAIEKLADRVYDQK